MNDLPSSALLQQSHARPKSGEELEMLGKQAAAKYLDGTCDTLSASVVETVKKAGLSPEQVKRVIEFANTDAFLKEFQKEGSAHKVVEFHGGPANYSDVLKDLNDGGGGTVFDNGHDYNLPPADFRKTAMANRERLGLEETKLADAFGVEEALLPFAEPLAEALDMKEKLAATRDLIDSEISQLEVQYLSAVEELHHEVKQASLGGTTLGQVLRAWQEVTEDVEYVKTAFAQLTPRLLADGVFESPRALEESLVKTASVGRVNVEHPLVHSFAHYCSTLGKLANVRASRADVQNNLETITTFLHESTKQAGAGKVVKQIVEVADKVAPAVGGAAGALAETATRYAPHAAAAYGAHRLYRGIEESPTGNKVLSFVPGTRANKIRQYYAAQRQGG